MASNRAARALVLVVGGILLAVSPFLAWVRILGLFNVDLFTLLRAAGDPSDWAWVAVVIGLGVAVAGIGALYEGGETTARVGAAAVAVFVLAAGASGVTQLVHVVTESRGLVGFGPGLFLAGLSEVAIVLGVALPRRVTRIQEADVADDERWESTQLTRGTEPVVVLTRRTARRGLVVLLTVLIFCGIGIGAYLASRPAGRAQPKGTYTTPHYSTTGTSMTTKRKPATTGFTVLAPATVPPVYAECNVPVSHSMDGNLYPLLCADGGVNIRAWDGYTSYIGGPLFLLGRHADAAVVVAAMCEAYYHKPADATAVEVQSAEELAAAYYGWKFHVATHFLPSFRRSADRYPANYRGRFRSAW